MVQFCNTAVWKHHLESNWNVYKTWQILISLGLTKKNFRLREYDQKNEFKYIFKKW